MNPRYDLKRIIDIEKWHKLQDSLSLVTRMAIITVDYKGVPVTKHSRCQAFCQGVRKDGNLSSYCQKCDARGGLEAVRTNKPYVYRCHFGIVDIAVPIIVEGQYIGAIMAGQIKLRDADLPLEQIVTRPPNAETDRKFKELEPEYRALPELSSEEVSAIADMLFHLCNYIVGEAIQKHATVDMYKKVLTAEPAAPDPVSAAPQAYEQIQAMQHELSSTLIEAKIKQGTERAYRAANPLLQPAFDYMYRHKNETCACRIWPRCATSVRVIVAASSPGKRGNFSVFVPRLKIEWAKQLLETTDLSVNHIGDELGFADPGYFIKTFKKFESLTPASIPKNLFS
ncbi:PocR ligand-binding domain-containing protein [Paenibacillus sp. JTLBN-2024]